MSFPRRNFLAWISTCFAVALTNIHAQDQQPRASQPRYISPYQAIENAASPMKPGDKDSVRALVDALANFPSLYRRMPDPMAAVVKQRVIDAQMAYLDGKVPGIVDGAVADAINALATAFETPDSGRVSLLMVQFFHSSLAFGMPIFMQPDPSRTYNASAYLQPSDPSDLPNEPMSPAQALFVLGLLIDQKLGNPNYQAAPAEWDRDFYPRLVKEAQARQELQRGIAAGEVQPKYEGRLVSRGPNDLETMVLRRIREMSVADGLKLFNDAFARLGIQ